MMRMNADEGYWEASRFDTCWARTMTTLARR